MQTALIILAAGIGSRFGGGLKQLEPVGLNAEIIIDYSIHDAIAAGFNTIIFVIRRDIEKDFKEIFGTRIEAICKPLGIEICYAYQNISDVPISLPDGRIKPWGTGHAVLACKNLIAGPFAVINADDYYGKDSFIKAVAFLHDCSAHCKAEEQYALIGYVLKNTLSDNGGVTRGICKVKEGRLVKIDETHNIVKIKRRVLVERVGKYIDIVEGASSNSKVIPLDSLVSMNFWCFPASFIKVLEKGFTLFLANMTDPLKDEYLLPNIVDGLLKTGTSVSVLPTNDQWFGITYKEDKQAVVEGFKKLYADGIYQEDLYGDLNRAK